MIELPAGRERDYLLTFGAAAIYVATCNGRPTIVVAARDPLRSLIAIEHRLAGQRENGGFPATWEPAHAFWFNSLELAALIAERARVALPAAANSNLLDVGPDEAERAIRKAAGHVPLTEHAAAMARARENSARLDSALSEAKRTGQLQFFNRAYSAYRQEQGPAAMPYPMAERRLRRVILESLQKTENFFVNPTVIQRVFSISNEV